ncbi:hypothetical protein HN011_010834, partial [Eciton burchellii]
SRAEEEEEEEEDRGEDMVVLELEAVYAQAAPHTKLLNKRFVGAHHWLGPLKEALVARLVADKVRLDFGSTLRATSSLPPMRQDDADGCLFALPCSVRWSPVDQFPGFESAR